MDDNEVRAETTAAAGTTEREYEPRDYRYSFIFYSVFGAIGVLYTVRVIVAISNGTAEGLDIFVLVISAGMAVAAVVYLANVLIKWRKSRR
jgi:hypothetical protein